jgi:hypothetical protein
VAGLSNSLRRARTEPSAFADVHAAQARGVLVYFARRTFDVEAARYIDLSRICRDARGCPPGRWTYP